MAQKIIEDIYWIGMDAPESREFHGILTPRGGSYNSFLIVDEKPALIDTTNTPFFEDYLSSLKSIIDPGAIRYIVINHAENDHAGAIKEVMAACQNATVVCTEKCREFLEAAFQSAGPFHIVGDNDTLQIGKRTLRFLMDPMVHWPETMMTYSETDKMLVSGDLFGTEISHGGAFADELEPFRDITRDYFTLVLRPFALSVTKAIEKAKRLEIAYLASTHGPIYRKDIDDIIDYNAYMASAPEEQKATIIYASIWHSSEKMAQMIAETIRGKGIPVKAFDITKTNLVTLMAESLTSKVLVLGSLTMLGGYHPMFNALFPFLRLNCQQGKVAAVYGTYGWCSSAVPKLKKELEEIKYHVIDSVDLRFGPKTEDDFNALKAFGNTLAQAVKKE